MIARSTDRAFGVGRALGAAMGIGGLVAAILGTAVAPLMLPVRVGPLAASVMVKVSEGDSAFTVGLDLERRGLVRSAHLFAVAARLHGVDRHLQAGFYRLRPDMSLPQIVRIMEGGRVATETVTVPEGATIRSIAALLERNSLADAARFEELARDDRWLFEGSRPIPKPPGSLEGYLFPDTYRIAIGQSEESIIRRMVARFFEKAMPLYRELATPGGQSLHEAVTLASIIEKEAMRESERPIISSVFHNRLRRGRPLQADPTLMYVLHPPPRRLLSQHLSIDSPYNTYRYPGLPPTPIASPGLASLRAALRPSETPFLYFVARGDGTHIFSRTFQEHVSARQRVPF